jgi:hypothetical protein
LHIWYSPALAENVVQLNEVIIGSTLGADNGSLVVGHAVGTIVVRLKVT